MQHPFQPGSTRRRQPVFNLPPVTKVLAIGLAAIHAVLALVGDDVRLDVIEALAFVPALFSAQFGPDGGIGLGVNLRLVGHMLMHADLAHLALNVGFLMVFGSICERAIGGWRLIVLLLVSGAVGALTFAAVSPHAGVALIGASGAVYGAAGAMTRLVFLRRGSLRAALTFGAALMAVNLLIGVFGGAIFGGTQDIAWQAHVGGFFAGLALIFLLPPRARPGHLRPEHMRN